MHRRQLSGTGDKKPSWNAVFMKIMYSDKTWRCAGGHERDAGPFSVPNL